ncbi:MAG: 6,7-dimethyl-8-ribityllumazine synthase [Planctomycetales bacterium]|nr:6,7-dimethyl-8-ribityllumazine synthase [Planctomycetales bacterium]
MPKTLEGRSVDGRGPIAIVVSRYNNSITMNLLEGAISTLTEYGVADDDITVSWVPGAWELPVVAAHYAQDNKHTAVICLGAVIKGETTHDEYINHQVSQSLGRLAVENTKPVIFGVLTCNSLEQAINRSGGTVGNKGAESAMAALEMSDLMGKLNGSL